MMSLRHFTRTLDGDVDPADAQKQYVTYEVEHIKKLREKTFEKLRKHEWFYERYNPVLAKKKGEEEMAAIAKKVKEFGQFGDSQPNFEPVDAEKEAKDKEDPAGENADHDDAKAKDGSANYRRYIYIPGIPSWCLRADLEKVRVLYCKKKRPLKINNK